MQGFDALPDVDRARIVAFRSRNLSWDHRFYNRADAEAWLRDNADERTCRAYYAIDPNYHAARSDLLRYLICEKEGGLYLDVKSEAARPLDEVLRPSDEFLLSQWPELQDRSVNKGGHEELAHIPGDEFVIWYIAASAGHPFLQAVIQKVLTNIENYNPWQIGVGAKGVLRTTGPIAYTLAIHPMLKNHTHRFVDAEKELGFYPFRHDDFKSHRGQYGRHYSMIHDPVVISAMGTRLSARLWFSSIRPEIDRSVRRFHKVVNRLSRLRP